MADDSLARRPSGPPMGLPNHRDPAELAVDLADRLLDNVGPEQKLAEMSDVFRRAWLSRGLNLKETEPYRVRVAWRWVREAALLKSLVGDDEMLGHALMNDEYNPWREGGVGSKPRPSAYVKVRADVVDLLNEGGGLPLLPPPVPDKWLLETGEPAPEYSPRIDLGITLWMQAFGRVCSYLGVMRGSVDNPDEGRWGMMGLTQAETLRMFFPSPLQIITWEEIMVRETWDLLVKGGKVQAGRDMRDRYGLVDVEVGRLISLAGIYGMKYHSVDIETERALQNARLDDFMLRCRDAPNDLRAELQALKQKALVNGLTANQADSFIHEVSTLIEDIGRESLPVRSLPPELPAP